MTDSGPVVRHLALGEVGPSTPTKGAKERAIREGTYQPPSPPKERMTIDEMLDALSETARDPSRGLDQMRAMKMLASMQSNQALLDVPLDEDEVISRLSRLMKASGIVPVYAALRRAFTDQQRSTWNKAQDREDNPYRDPDKKLPKTLEELYQDFPNAKPPGYPHVTPEGYPEGGAPKDKMRWVRRDAWKRLQILIEQGRAYAPALKEPE